MPRHEVERIVAAIEKLSEEPFPHGFHKLAGTDHIYRIRIGDYRVYFERHALGVLVHRIMSRHTLKDFFYRSGIKVGEDQALQENPKFWELIEAAKSSEKI